MPTLGLKVGIKLDIHILLQTTFISYFLVRHNISDMLRTLFLAMYLFWHNYSKLIFHKNYMLSPYRSCDILHILASFAYTLPSYKNYGRFRRYRLPITQIILKYFSPRLRSVLPKSIKILYNISRFCKTSSICYPKPFQTLLTVCFYTISTIITFT